MPNRFSQVDLKEVDFVETSYVRDVDSRLFQALVLQSLEKIQGVAPSGGSFIDSIFRRDNSEKIKSVFVEQDLKRHSVSIRVEVNVQYGISIPQKAEEIQTLVAKEISQFTGLHVSCVHVIFKDLIVESKKAPTAEEINSGL